MENLNYLQYTYMHRKAFEFTVRKLIKDETIRQALLTRARKHDLDKSLLYTLIDKEVASDYHRSTCSHHMENSDNKNRLDKMEAVVDFECAGYTKADKPRNAYRTVMDFKPRHMDDLLDIMKEWGIDSDYKNTPQDSDWVEYAKSIPEPTEENILNEIYWYIITYPGEAREVYSYACDYLKKAGK